MALVSVPVRTVLSAEPVSRPRVEARPDAQAEVKTDAEVETVAEVEAAPAPERSTTRRVALAVVFLLCCGFSYSIGWQQGWSAGTVGADARFNALNEELLENVRLSDPSEPTAELAGERAAVRPAAAEAGSGGGATRS